MANNLLISESTSSFSKADSSLDVARKVNGEGKSTNQTRTLKQMNSLYQTDQQVKLLHLEAEIETLLLELRTIRERNLVSLIEKEVNL
ncbi:MAG: hypothetical protein O4861_18040 [Trichodesmium sp. St16_bin4-tuft]|nr:hypothetical protein [Trichodesmium sp. MAG_R01]MDE5069369.1 hypothetical protein [Trichodesmium sp. St4_bin8_1]MDE5070724.1 hypothetical protein [Trichodesmium sp. St5_bin8]MDE5077808.1 hypothetical protein [Trichodesmium sp. St2_bin6]MDE5100127.1 hypothetical protein [Trichodesmium sp. St16_bin4-tuft]MDE5104692.1 hypothetical protein [Trichodesmium sp. St19_bin2]